MKKGISPVVAVVLLIAIAVIAAVGVWYWVGSYTGKPAVGVGQTAMSITECNTTHVLVRNIGGVMVSSDANIYDSDGTYAGFIAISTAIPTAGVEPGEVKFIEITPASEYTVEPGVYRVIDSKYPEVTFTCTA